MASNISWVILTLSNKLKNPTENKEKADQKKRGLFFCFVFVFRHLNKKGLFFSLRYHAIMVLICHHIY